MFRDSMSHISKEKIENIVEKLGIQRSEFESIKNNKMQMKNTYISAGPDRWNPYWASYYGTISIKDF